MLSAQVRRAALVVLIASLSALLVACGPPGSSDHRSSVGASGARVEPTLPDDPALAAGLGDFNAVAATEEATAPEEPIAAAPTELAAAPPEAPTEPEESDGSAPAVQAAEERPSAPASDDPSGPVPPTPDPGLDVSVERIYYPVVGTTTAGLVAQVLQFGPKDEFGSWGASTTWQYRWRSTHDRSTGACRAKAVHADLKITLTLPRWDVPAGADERVVLRWDQFLAAAELHENGHQEIAIEAGNELVRALRDVPAQPSCPAFREAAQAAVDAVMERHRQQQAAYDEETEHGVRQGAIFP